MGYDSVNDITMRVNVLRLITAQHRATEHSISRRNTTQLILANLITCTSLSKSPRNHFQFTELWSISLLYLTPCNTSTTTRTTCCRSDRSHLYVRTHVVRTRASQQRRPGQGCAVISQLSPEWWQTLHCMVCSHTTSVCVCVCVCASTIETVIGLTSSPTWCIHPSLLILSYLTLSYLIVPL